MPTILTLLFVHWYANPDQRLGQLLVNLLGHDPAAHRGPDLFYVEDDVLEAKLRQVAVLTGRHQVVERCTVPGCEDCGQEKHP